MHLFLSYTISGLVIGAVYGIAASGLVLTYTTSGIFNFAHGAIAMLAAYVYWQFRFGWDWPAPICLILVLLILAPLLGALLYAGIMRGLRNTAEITKIVVTISVMLGIIALAQWIWNPTTPRNDFPFFGYTAKFKFLGVFVTDHEVIAIGAAVAIAVGLRYLFQRTRTGVAMRAVVDNPALLELNGGRPGRLAGISWAVGGALAALAGILITPVSGGTLDVTQLTLLVLDAIAAAMFGRLRSLPRTFIGAIVLGLASNYVLAYFPTTWTWASNFRISLPMIVLFVVLLVLPQDRLRGAILLRSRERFKVPSMKSAGLWSIILLAVILLLEVIMTSEAITALTVGMTFAIIALSLTVLTGYAGEINLAPVSLGAIATIFTFHLGLSGVGLHQRITLGGIFIGMAAAAVIGGLIALPALRLRGLYLALATLAFGVFVSDMIISDVSPHILPIFHTHFSIFTNGTLNVPKVKVGPLDLAAPKAFLTTVTVVFVVIGIGLIALRHSAYGRRLAAMKDSPAATATLGQNLIKLKLSVFVLSAAIAGLGGILMSSASISVNPNSFIIFVSLTLVMLTVVGGIGNVAGALIGGILAGVGFQAITSTFQNLYSHHGGPWMFIANLTLVAPAAIGVSLGRNPSGSVGQIVEGYAPLWRAKPVLAGGILLEVAAYLLVVTKVMSNWWFVFATAIIVFGIPVVGKALMPEAFAPRPPPGGSPPSASTTPLVESSTNVAPTPAASGPVRMGWEGGSTGGRP